MVLEEGFLDISERNCLLLVDGYIVDNHFEVVVGVDVLGVFIVVGDLLLRLELRKLI